MFGQDPNTASGAFNSAADISHGERVKACVEAINSAQWDDVLKICIGQNGKADSRALNDALLHGTTRQNGTMAYTDMPLTALKTLINAGYQPNDSIWGVLFHFKAGKAPQEHIEYLMDTTPSRLIDKFIENDLTQLANYQDLTFIRRIVSLGFRPDTHDEYDILKAAAKADNAQVIKYCRDELGIDPQKHKSGEIMLYVSSEHVLEEIMNGETYFPVYYAAEDDTVSPLTALVLTHSLEAIKKLIDLGACATMKSHRQHDSLDCSINRFDNAMFDKMAHEDILKLVSNAWTEENLVQNNNELRGNYNPNTPIKIEKYHQYKKDFIEADLFLPPRQGALVLGDIDALIQDVRETGKLLSAEDLKYEIEFDNSDPDVDMPLNIGRIMGICHHVRIIFDDRLWQGIPAAEKLSKVKDIYDALPTFAKIQCTKEFELTRALATVSMVGRQDGQIKSSRKMPRLK